jgi:hypothetical protein
MAVEGLSVNCFQDVVDVECVAGHSFSVFSTEGLQEAFLVGETTTVLESLGNPAGHIVIHNPL